MSYLPEGDRWGMFSMFFVLFLNSCKISVQCQVLGGCRVCCGLKLRPGDKGICEHYDGWLATDWLCNRSGSHTCIVRFLLCQQWSKRSQMEQRTLSSQNSGGWNRRIAKFKVNWSYPVGPCLHESLSIWNLKYSLNKQEWRHLRPSTDFFLGRVGALVGDLQLWVST